jgi:hypothetical protein
VFDRTVAHRLATICREIYVGKSADLPATIAGGTTRPIQAGGAHGKTSLAVVVDRPGVDVVVAFRGTLVVPYGDPLVATVDWIRNLDAGWTDLRAHAAALGVPAGSLVGRVHHGFLDELAAVHPRVVDVLRASLAGRPLYVTGHSQGAAVATIATTTFRAAALRATACYAFAPPRAGDEALRAAAEGATDLFRLERGDDVVPHVPPARALVVLDSRTATRPIAAALRKLVRGWQAGAAAGIAARVLLAAVPEAFRPHVQRALSLVGTDFEAYRSAGALWSADGRGPFTAISPADEETLLARRVERLPLRPKGLFGDHWIGHYQADLAPTPPPQPP